MFAVVAVWCLFFRFCLLLYIRVVASGVCCGCCCCCCVCAVLCLGVVVVCCCDVLCCYLLFGVVMVVFCLGGSRVCVCFRCFVGSWCV